MRDALEVAIIEELETELTQAFSPRELPHAWEKTPGRIEFHFDDDPAARYTLGISLTDCGDLTGILLRGSANRLKSESRRLADPSAFSSLSASFASEVRQDRIRIRTLSRIIEKFKPQFVQSAKRMEGWIVSQVSTGLDREHASVAINCQPRQLRDIIPDLYFRLSLEIDEQERFRVIVKVLTPASASATGMARLLNRAGAGGLTERTMEDLPSAMADQQRQLEKLVLDWLLPIESDLVTPRVRQFMLVFVPLRLADWARSEGGVEWSREWAEICLVQLGERSDDARNVVRRLFFQLLRLELARPDQRQQIHAEYHQLGMDLATLRREDQMLPYNPVLVYDKYTRGKTRPDAIFSLRDRVEYEWFLNNARLEQVIDLMALA